MQHRGFTLIELLLVMGIVGILGGIILPNVGITPTNQMRESITNFSNSVRATYDSAILEGRIHRLVLTLKTGEFYTEAAPVGFLGRPAPSHTSDSLEETRKAEDRVRLLEDLDKAAADPRKSKEDEKRSYSFRSILVTHRSILKPIQWNEVSDAILTRKSLSGKVAFASVVTVSMREPLTFGAAEEKQTAQIYFFPNGEVQMATVQLGIIVDKAVDEQGIKYTLNIDPLSGKVAIVDGFEEAEFLKNRR